MSDSLHYKIGFRYAGLKKDAHLLSFLSRIATVGLVLSVALLIVVMSVMNGFDRELRTRILSIVPHITFYGSTSDDNVNISDIISDDQEVVRVEPFIEKEGMLKSGIRSEPLIFYGMENYSELEKYIRHGDLKNWESNKNGIVISQYFANKLSLKTGDNVMGLFPVSIDKGVYLNQPKIDIAVFTVTAIFNTETEVDKVFAWAHLSRLQELFNLPDVQGYRVSVKDIFYSNLVGRRLITQLPKDFYYRDWSQTHGNLYQAVQMSRAMVSLLMFVIIAVAVFNIVSTLMLVVMEKKQSIAILQVMGASRLQILKIFITQGVIIGLVGSLSGACFGALVSLALPEIVSMIESWFQFKLLSTEVYPVSYIPSDLRLSQVLWIILVSVVFSLLASLYPAWKGACTVPAQVLRYE